MREGDQTFEELAAEAMAALDNVPLPTALLDERGTIRWQNKASFALRGSRIGSAFTDYLAPDDQAFARGVLERILATGEPAELAVRALNAAGKYVLLDGRWSLVRVRGGGKVVVVLSLGDTADPEASAVADRAARLTPRQRDVLRLLTAGRSTGEIATELDLRPTTVRNHIANLLAVLGVHSRLQAVVAAQRAGLIDS